MLGTHSGSVMLEKPWLFLDVGCDRPLALKLFAIQKLCQIDEAAVVDCRWVLGVGGLTF